MRSPLLMALFAVGLAAQVPDLAFDSAPNFIRMPEHIHMGEVAGVATDSKGNVYVYTRTGSELCSGVRPSPDGSPKRSGIRIQARFSARHNPPPA